jgi:hypothetical protein
MILRAEPDKLYWSNSSVFYPVFTCRNTIPTSHVVAQKHTLFSVLSVFVLSGYAAPMDITANHIYQITNDHRIWLQMLCL